MYHQLWKRYKTEFHRLHPRLPEAKSFSIGRALWALSRQKGIKFVEIAKKTGIEEGSILRMSSSHSLTSTPERIRVIAESLGVSTSIFFRAAREEFYGNFFVTKARMPSEKECSDYARHGLILHPQIVLRFPDQNHPDFRLLPHTPPVESLDDFFSATILISSGKKIEKLGLSASVKIHLTVMSGAVLVSTQDDSKNVELVAGQAAVFSAQMLHGLKNLSKARDAEILICLGPTAVLAKPDLPSATMPLHPKDLSPANLIHQTQCLLSPQPDHPIPLSTLAERAGLSARDLDPLVKDQLTHYPLEKMERLAELLNIPLEDWMSGQFFGEKSAVEVTQGGERGAYDYRSQFGMMLYPWIKYGSGRRDFFIGQASMTPAVPPASAPGCEMPLAGKEKKWEGQHPGYALARVLNGKLGVQTGLRHIYSDLDREDTVYFDQSLGFSVRNFSAAEPADFFLMTRPCLF